MASEDHAAGIERAVDTRLLPGARPSRARLYGWRQRLRKENTAARFALEETRPAEESAVPIEVILASGDRLRVPHDATTLKQMAEVLSISTKTIASHRENIKRKLELRSTAELTRHAIEQGLV